MRRKRKLRRKATGKDVGWLIAVAKRALDAGAEIVIIESEGIAESAATWRTDVAARVINEIGLERGMFEAADPPVFEWYVKNYGNDVNLFVDYSLIVQLEALRSGIWGTKSSWGRILNVAECARGRPTSRGRPARSATGCGRHRCRVARRTFRPPPA